MKKRLSIGHASQLPMFYVIIARQTALLLLLFIFSSCSVNEKDEWEILQEKDCLDDYFKFALVNPNHDEIDLIYDSITSKVRKNNIHIIYLTYKGTDQFEEIDQFWIEKFDPYDNPGHITFRNSFSIDISNPDTMYVEGCSSSFDGINKKLDEFYDNPDNLETLSEQIPIETELLGDINVSKGMIGISGYNYRERSTFTIHISKYFESYLYIEKYFIYRRDKLANELFAKPYKELSEEEKSTISEISPIFIWFIF